MLPEERGVRIGRHDGNRRVNELRCDVTVVRRESLALRRVVREVLWRKLLEDVGEVVERVVTGLRKENIVGVAAA